MSAQIPDTPTPDQGTYTRRAPLASGSPVAPGRNRPVPPPLSMYTTPQKGTNEEILTPRNENIWNDQRGTAFGEISPLSGSENAEYVVVGNGIVMHRSDHEQRPWEERDIQLPPEPPAPRGLSNALELLQTGNAHLTVIKRQQSLTEQGEQIVPDTTHLSMTGVPVSEILLDFLSVPINLVVLDLSNTGLTAVPSSLMHCTALEELNLSINPLQHLTTGAGKEILSSLSNLRVLLLDDCGLDGLPMEIATLSRLQILALRQNRLSSLPSWIHVLDLRCLLLEGNEMAEPWSLILGPLVHPLMSDVTRHFAVLSTIGPDSASPTTPASTTSRGGRATQASPGTAFGRRPPRDFKYFGSLSAHADEDDNAWRRLIRRTPSASSSPAADSLTFRPSSTSLQSAKDSAQGMLQHPTISGLTTGLFITFLPLPSLAQPPRMPTTPAPRISCFLPMYDKSASGDGFEIPQEHEDFVRNILAYYRDLDSLLPQHQTHPLVIRAFDGSSDVRASPIRPTAAGTKEDAVRCQLLIKEIISTERTYVAGLNELTDIYIRQARKPLDGSGSDERALPPEMERVVFGHIEGIVHFHNAVFLPLLEQAAEDVLYLDPSQIDPTVQAHTSAVCAGRVADVFSSHAAYFKMYMNYVNQCDLALHYVTIWTECDSVRGKAMRMTRRSQTPVSQLVTLGRRLNRSSDGEARDLWSDLSPSQQRRIHQYVRRCREDPRHSQLNLEGYLLLPIQRIPRYRLLLEQLVQSTSCRLVPEVDAALERALEHISLVVSWVNEGKRQTEQGRRLLLWQKRMKGSNVLLVEPHRKLICDGPLRMRRIVRRAPAQNDSYSYMDVLEQTSMDRKVQLLLCNDILVILAHVSDPSTAREESRDAEPDYVELVAVLRPCTVASPVDPSQPPAPPTSVIGCTHLRIVDTRCIVYLTAHDERDAVRWCDLINAQTF